MVNSPWGAAVLHGKLARPRPPADDPVIGLGLLAGGANVIMQLSRPEVGYGVHENGAAPGSLFRSPVRRTRMTLTYLAVALLGTADERDLFRQSVDRAHRPVRSSATSPVRYNAFDPRLQLWVAACLYRGVEDVGDRLAGPLTDDEKDRRYQQSAALATTLQVPPGMWPEDREAFDSYWRESLGAIHIDETIRRYLTDVTLLRFLPPPVPQLLGPLNRFVTTGFLPERFRREMRLEWDARQQQRFDLLVRALRGVSRPLPGPLRRFPLNACLWDLRLRTRLGRPAV